MKTVSVYEAKTHLSRLLVEVERGEEVLITRNGAPVGRLVPPAPPAARSVASLRGLVLSVADDAFAPMEPADAASWSDGPLLAAEPPR
jgi:prevent-host-death family protein